MSTHDHRPTKPQRTAPISPRREWPGPWRRYDIVKEGVIADRRGRAS